MGCDSHISVERLQKNGWVVIDDKPRYWAALRANGYENEAAIRPSFINVLGNRNYTLFAVIANVRNNNITPLPFAERGMPEDAAKKTVKQMPEDSDYHSHTWFTVRELLDTDWDAIGQQHGEAILYAHQFAEWAETGKVPDDCEDYPFGGEEVSKEEMTLLLMANAVKEVRKKQKIGGRNIDAGPYVRVPTNRTYRQLVPDLVSCLPDLEKLGNPEKIRVVISFDN